MNLGKAISDLENDEFWAIRAKAIHRYAQLESALFGLFVDLTGMHPKAAGVVFFKITNTQARNKIIEKLFQQKHGENFNLFRNSLLQTHLRPLDQMRNELVHWTTIFSVTDGNASLVLKPPAWFWNIDNSPEHDVRSILEFTEKCQFYRNIVTAFTLITGKRRPDIPDFPELSEADKKPWLDIFSQPIIYPPPEGHPLFQTRPGSDNPPQSSPP